jgi:hypothetical protein
MAATSLGVPPELLNQKMNNKQQRKEIKKQLKLVSKKTSYYG